MLKFHRSSTSVILLDSVTTLRALRQRALAHFTAGSYFLLRRGSFSTMVRAETRSRKPDIKTQTNNSLALRFLLSTCFMLEAMFGYLTTCRHLARLTRMPPSLEPKEA